ncbi:MULTISPECIES: DUF2065 domain-containing protein [unclassified Roseitalea]|uniref:DUF2065 domain-containing protein n=1 Tax=unclassified Roseitalea TaxID=2639107 RepID=UPI00273FF96A|nr:MULTISPECIES: DUF2065 domain-containing protein [unclassified Roseitalea]
MADLVTALGLVLVIEGIVYGAFPHLGRRIGEFLRTAPDDMLRIAGLASAAIGLGVVWFARAVM